MLQTVESYLALRRSVGYKLHAHERLLKSFATFAAACEERHVRRQTAIEWASRSASCEQREWRLAVVRRFASYAQAEDSIHEVPPSHVFGGRRRRAIPYIYSPSEIRSLLDAAARLGPEGSSRPHTYRTLFGLMAATGLRPSEALALRLADVTCDGLVIRETKFRKNRLVPLHGTTAGAIDRYIRDYRGVGLDDDHVFVSLRRRGLGLDTVLKTFAQLRREIGLVTDSGGPKPRLYCLRHTFAVRVLEACGDGRDRIARNMLALSTYLGHTKMADTYWYLEATPELIRDIADSCQAHMEGESS